MKLAIHNGTDKASSWNSNWIDYCEQNKIPYIGINCYATNIIQILKKEQVTHLMWAFSLALPKDHIVAKSVMNSAETIGIKVFPNFNNNWHFEDKIAQKYLLEAIEAPVVKSWAFFEKEEAYKFLLNVEFPIVAKLRKGAGSTNVILLKSYKGAIKYVDNMFNKGVTPSQNIVSLSKNKINKVSNGIKTNLNLFDLYKKIRIHYKRRKLFTKEIGYVYFQEFLPNNLNDLRIAIVGNRAWGFYRGVRKNDFRASGSGIIDYDTPIPIDTIKKSFEITKKLNTQSLAFDYVKSQDGTYKIVEICYGYVGKAIYNCLGYWDDELKFHKGHFMPEELILQDFIKE